MHRYSEGSTAAPPKALQPPLTSGDGQAGIHPPPSVAFSTDFTEPANNAATAECLCISIGTRIKFDYKPSPVGFAGIDTIHIRLKKFTVAEESELTVHTENDATTGRDLGHPLYVTSEHVVHGKKAFYNHPKGLFRFTIVAEGDAYLNVELPKMLAGNNVEEVADTTSLHMALDKAETLLMEAGIRADLRHWGATITRLDICRTQKLKRPVKKYKDVIRNLSYPRTEATNYKSGARWSNTAREVCFYDKGKQQTDEDSNTARIEVRFKKGRVVKDALDTQSVAELCQPEYFNRISETYVDATGKLLSAEAVETSTVTGVGVEAVLEAMQDKRGGHTKALQVIGIANLTGSLKETYLDKVEALWNRQTAYRVEKKLEEMQCYASLYAAATRTQADLYAELKKAFTTQTN